MIMKGSGFAKRLARHDGRPMSSLFGRETFGAGRDAEMLDEPRLPNGPKLAVLEQGSCEALKAGVHATALGLAVLMGLYNAAAWLLRRERHLAVNTILYAALTAWEREQVAHHMAGCRQLRDELDQQKTDTPTMKIAHG